MGMRVEARGYPGCYFSGAADLGFGSRVSHQPGLMDWAIMAVGEPQGSSCLCFPTSLSSFMQVLGTERRSS